MGKVIPIRLGKAQKSDGVDEPKKRDTSRKKSTLDAMPFKKLWPKILIRMTERPKDTYRDLWDYYQESLDDVFSLRQFTKLLETNGLTKSALNSSVGMKANIQAAVKTFVDTKKEYAEKHMQRIHKKLEEVHDVIDAIPVEEKNVGRVLGLVSQLHREGRLAYGIDEESRGDQKVTNLAVLIGYDPTVKQAKGEVIESQ